ncbi:mitogen-activated protein kinase [Colletotrichum fioriniae]|uniref:mitogen-activated protein kinase n=1 Tax=Colletotrichum fioriniae TaxID=710243 RepID=UPI0032DA0454|nr:mitogen-activated protein kinase [Colletotrichum fioriniae]
MGLHEFPAEVHTSGSGPDSLATVPDFSHTCATAKVSSSLLVHLTPTSTSVLDSRPVLMADSDWRTQLSASDRYENIQRIKSVLETASPDAKDTSQSEAFSVENQAYKDSSSRAQYDEICQLVSSANLSRAEAPAPADDQLEDAGVTIGSYENCTSFASGLTSEVYRCKDRALKVIVETHNIEPHNPQREAKILATLKRPCIPLLETFRDQEQRFVLVFPYKPMTLADVIDKGTIPLPQVRRLFKDIFTALVDIHGQGIIHRDIKPEAILLDGPDGPAYLSDFGTAWHPAMSIVSEPAKSKILDIGTGPYRAPEALFGDKAYGPSVDMWAAGAMLAECCRSPPKPLFDSRPAHEDGNQLGLILSIFKTLGTPTREAWPEATSFKTPPFEMYRMFDGQPWTEILPEVDPHMRDLISSLVRFDSKRATAEQALQHKFMVETEQSQA